MKVEEFDKCQVLNAGKTSLQVANIWCTSNTVMQKVRQKFP